MSTNFIAKRRHQPLQARTLLSLFILLIIQGLILGDETGPSQMTPLITFDNRAEIDSWRVINDGVMGGLSRSSLEHSPEGYAVFSGRLSLRNNGGFASIRRLPGDYNLTGSDGIALRVRGDGRVYQFRVRIDGAFDGISYTTNFKTEVDRWIIVKLPFSSLKATFRGRSVPAAPDLNPAQIQQVGFLIADKIETKFNLDIDWIKAYKSADE